MLYTAGLAHHATKNGTIISRKYLKIEAKPHNSHASAPPTHDRVTTTLPSAKASFLSNVHGFWKDCIRDSGLPDQIDYLGTYAAFLC